MKRSLPSSTLDDNDLIQQVSRGDEQAFRQLYQQYSLPVYNYLLRLARDDAVAEDLLQEVFLAVWRGAGQYRGQAKLKTWIYRIAHHRAVSWLRRKRPLELSSDLEDDRPDRSPEIMIEAHWEHRQVHDALNRLTPKHRAVLELAFVQEMSYNEIAEVVGCPVGTVKSRMSYALRALNALLTNSGWMEDAEHPKENRTRF